MTVLESLLSNMRAQLNFAYRSVGSQEAEAFISGGVLYLVRSYVQVLDEAELDETQKKQVGAMLATFQDETFPRDIEQAVAPLRLKCE